MGFLKKAAAWIVVDLVLIVAGGLLIGATAPRVNPHNDWGATGATYGLIGMTLGSGLTTFLVLRWNHNQFMRRCGFSSGTTLHSNKVIGQATGTLMESESGVPSGQDATRLALKTAAWTVLNVAFLIGGAVLGFLIGSVIDPRNSWGVSWAISTMFGALFGSSLTIILLLLLNEQRINRCTEMRSKPIDDQNPGSTLVL